jgi:hypothetical protein
MIQIGLALALQDIICICRTQKEIRETSEILSRKDCPEYIIINNTILTIKNLLLQLSFKGYY